MGNVSKDRRRNYKGQTGKGHTEQHAESRVQVGARPARTQRADPES